MSRPPRPLVVAALIGAVSALLGSGLAAAQEPSAGPSVTLIERGEAPRSTLRYDLAAMREAAMVMDMDMDMDMRMPEFGSQSQAMPRMRMRMAFRDLEVLPQDRLRSRFLLESTEVLARPGVDPMLLPLLQGALAEAGNPTGMSVIDNRGRSIEQTMDTRTMSPAMQQMMQGWQDAVEQLAAPLPEEAVGVGARWRVVQDIQANGVRMQQTSEYTLLERTPTHFRVQVSITQRAAPQRIEDPSLPPGTVVMLAALNGEGSGEATVPFASLVPTSTVQSRTTMRMETEGPDGRPTELMTMTLGMTAHIRPATPSRAP